jgi:secondary thiamine-phosphate synthase enzyme
VKVVRGEAVVETSGHGDVVDLTAELGQWLARCGGREGLLSVFVPGSTAAVTTIEFEPGAVADLSEALERIAPSDRPYHHDLRWGDGNGFSHLRAALVGPSEAIPVAGGEARLGTWQQVVLVECDRRPRRRHVLFTFVGSCDEGA